MEFESGQVLGNASKVSISTNQQVTALLEATRLLSHRAKFMLKLRQEFDDINLHKNFDIKFGRNRVIN